MHRNLFAALAAAIPFASVALAHAGQHSLTAKDLVMMDRVAEPATSEYRRGAPGLVAVCPRARTPHDDGLAGCAAEVGPQIAKAHTMAKAPDAGCTLPSEPWGIPAALDAAISGPADKDRACMKALLIPEARIMFASTGADGAPAYKLLTLGDWISRARSLGHVALEEKQLSFRIDRFGDIAHLWSLYLLRSDGDPDTRGINSIQAIKEAGGWRIAGITVQAESANAPLPEEYLP